MGVLGSATSGKGQRLPTELLLQVGLAVTLMALSPCAMSLPPAEDIYAANTYSRDIAGSLFPFRAGLVAYGLLAAAISALVAFGALVLRQRQLEGLVIHGSVVLFSWMVGWRCFPYWANGVFRAERGHRWTHGFDPKDLIPMEWIGEVWRVGVFLLYLAGPIAFLALLAGCTAAARRGSWRTAGLGAALLALSALSFFALEPAYGAWLAD